MDTWAAIGAAACLMNRLDAGAKVFVLANRLPLRARQA